jgi:hypothetical protein
MAKTFIDYQNNKGFWITESFMQLVWCYVFQEIIKPQYNFTNKQEIVEDIELDINGIHSGYLVLTWNDYLINSSEEQTMIQVLQNVKTTLQNKESYRQGKAIRQIHLPLHLLNQKVWFWFRKWPSGHTQIGHNIVNRQMHLSFSFLYLIVFSPHRWP